MPARGIEACYRQEHVAPDPRQPRKSPSPKGPPRAPLPCPSEGRRGKWRVRQSNGCRAEQDLDDEDGCDCDDGGSDEGRLLRRRHAPITSATTSGATRSARRRCDHSQIVPSLIDGKMLPRQSGQSGQVSPAPLIRVQLPRTTAPRAIRSVPSARRRQEFSCQFQGTRAPSLVTMTLDAGSLDSSPPRGGVDARAKAKAVKRWWALAALLLLVGCREVRVKTLSTGTTTVLGGIKSSSSATRSISQNSAFMPRCTFAASSALFS